MVSRSSTLPAYALHLTNTLPPTPARWNLHQACLDERTRILDSRAGQHRTIAIAVHD
jgi:hypothetical protein